MIDGTSSCVTLTGSSEMEVMQHLINDTVILSLRGTTFSDSTVAWLKKIILTHEQSGIKKLILDLGHVHHLNSLGITVLLSARKSMQRVNGKLTLAEINENVREILRRTSLLERFQILPTLGLAPPETVAAIAVPTK